MQVPTLLFCSEIDDPAPWRALFARERPDVDFRIWPDLGDPSEVTHALVFKPPAGLLASLPGLKAIFSLGAGVDQIVVDPAFPSMVPLFRLVDAGLREQMTEYALYGVLHWHRGMGRYAAQQAERIWRMGAATHPSDRTVGVMGLGVFGADIVQKLAALGFKVVGWRRSPTPLEGVETYSGAGGFAAFLGRSEILVNVLPLTEETRGVLNDALFSKLPGGGALIHLGRGRHLVEADLMAALDDGRLDWAMIDVFPTEPLPQEHPFWTHPRLSVTPHIAAQPVGHAAERLVLENFNRFERGEEPEGRVDPIAGY